MKIEVSVIIESDDHIDYEILKTRTVIIQLSLDELKQIACNKARQIYEPKYNKITATGKFNIEINETTK